MRRRVVLIGASGVFGSRLARRIASWPDIELVLAARDRRKLEALAAELGPDVEVAAFDRTRPQDLAKLEPWVVIDCAGPFQAADYALPSAALEAAAHYLDLADARGFVAGFSEALDDRAKATGRLAVTGASSTPALSHAALDQITEGWSRIDGVLAAISPGARAPAGLSVIQAILSWAGQPLSVFTGGRWRTKAGWSGLRRLDMPGLGKRWLSLADTPDLDLLAQRYTPRREALFLAGVEVGVMHLGLWLLGWLVRLRLMRSLAALARPLLWLVRRLQALGSDRGGMIVQAWGADGTGQDMAARWSWLALSGSGPDTPTLPAAAILRALLDERLTETGARTAAGLINVDEIAALVASLPITIRTDWAAPSDAALWRRVFGRTFETFPPSVRIIHAGLAPETFTGLALTRGGAHPLARFARLISGTPRPGRYPNFSVSITPTADGEAWTRRFGRRAFASRLRSLPGDIGRFEERLGPLAFRFEGVPAPGGFGWRMLGWRLGPIPLPTALAPRIRARTFARDGYRFRVLIAHPWTGVLVGYAGRLNTSPSLPPTALAVRSDR